MADEKVKLTETPLVQPTVPLPVVKEMVVPPLYRSKAFHFNIFNTVFVPVIWPFLTKEFRSSDYALASITAWYLIGNAIFRVLTRNRALKILDQMELELGQQVTKRNGDY